MAWVAGVNLNWPFFSKPSYWSTMSRERLRAHPLHRFNDSMCPITKEKPGTPSIHLFAELTIKSMLAKSRLRGTAPKLLIASTKKDALGVCSLTSLPTAPTGWMTPVEVSQCTIATLVMDLSLFKISSTLAKSAFAFSSPCKTTWTKRKQKCWSFIINLHVQSSYFSHASSYRENVVSSARRVPQGRR